MAVKSYLIDFGAARGIGKDNRRVAATLERVAFCQAIVISFSCAQQKSLVGDFCH
jgi:hypothetical protein